VLCKNLALDINELKPGNLLKDKDRLKNLDEQLSAPKKDVKQPEELPPITTTSMCDSYSRPVFFKMVNHVCKQTLPGIETLCNFSEPSKLSNKNNVLSVVLPSNSGIHVISLTKFDLISCFFVS
jgi:hypothetical protein